MTTNYDRSEHLATGPESSAKSSLDNTMVAVADAADRVAASVNAGVDRDFGRSTGRSSTCDPQQQAFDRQPDEFGVYRNDLVSGVATLFDCGVIHDHAEIGKQPEILRTRIDQVLGQNGGADCRPEVAKAFDPVGQNVIGRAWPTNEATRSGTIAARPQPGFEGRILFVVCVLIPARAPVAGFVTRGSGSPSPVIAPDRHRKHDST